MRPKILFTSGLIMSTVAVALLVVSGFNFQDLKPANWKNLRTVYAAAGDQIHGEEVINRARVVKYNCNWGGHTIATRYLYLGPAEILRTMRYIDSGGKPLFTWNEIYSVDGRDWRDNNMNISGTLPAATIESIGPTVRWSDVYEPNWKTLTSMYLNGATASVALDLPTTPANQFPCFNFNHGAANNGLYSAKEWGGGSEGFRSSIPLMWKISGSFQ